jgi:hypothetical protein
VMRTETNSARRASRALFCLGLVALLGGCAPRDAPPAVEFRGPAGSGQPRLAPLGAGRTALTWLEPAGAPASKRYALRIAVRRDGRWSEPHTVVESDSFFVNSADFPALVALPNGAWVVHWLARVPGGTYAYHVRLAISRDEGRTWSAPVLPHRDRTPQEHGFVSLVPWDDSTAAVVWLDGRDMRTPADPTQESDGDMTLRFTTVTSGGRLGADELLDQRTCECCQTAMVRAASGLVIAYRDRSPEEIRDIAIVRRREGGWTEPAIVAADNWHYPGCPVNGPGLAAAGDTVAIAWYTAAGGDPRVLAAFSLDGGVTWTPPRRISERRSDGRVDIAFVPGGAVLVTWVEDDEIRGRRFRVPDGAPQGPAWSVASTSARRSGGFPRVVALEGSGALYAWTTAEGIRVAAAAGGR